MMAEGLRCPDVISYDELVPMTGSRGSLPGLAHFKGDLLPVIPGVVPEISWECPGRDDAHHRRCEKDLRSDNCVHVQTVMHNRHVASEWSGCLAGSSRSEFSFSSVPAYIFLQRFLLPPSGEATITGGAQSFRGAGFA